ncbi:helix-turn-helix domain-containing protein [Hymenobacter rubripertinctus]|uniref:XRE family transcriptional regulator n=1 Tax=Hymenobacter rubripertinctus TaxID=2029981 RepID=A0A418QNX3_9BACT|nr:helix-turn-helix transcriptional regulator [Hymenobacter rubripertinctus]RIY06893.1 XRE family transcriptional regulator [Hymenobacter rubripertinctus]
MRQHIEAYVRPDGNRGLQVRELARATHVSAATLKLVLDRPELLAMNSLVGLAQLLTIPPAQLLIDVALQVSRQAAATPHQIGRKPSLRQRRTKPANAAQPATESVTAETLASVAATGAVASPSHQGPQASKATISRVGYATSGPSTVDFPEDLAVRVPYCEATFQQKALAVASLQQELKDHFPPLPLPRWATELDALHPDLWIEGQVVELDYADLTQLTQRLAMAPELPMIDPPVYNHRARYLARRQAEYTQQAIAALAELEQNPSAYGPDTRGLILKLAIGNGVVTEVLQAFGEADNYAQHPNQVPGGATVNERLFALHWQKIKASSFYPKDARQ